jgi:hypothetical protein
MLVVKITGEPEALVEGGHSYLLWMDKSLKLPRIVESYDDQDQLIEGLFIDDLRINPVFGEILIFKYYGDNSSSRAVWI